MEENVISSNDDTVTYVAEEWRNNEKIRIFTLRKWVFREVPVGSASHAYERASRWTYSILSPMQDSVLLNYDVDDARPYVKRLLGVVNNLREVKLLYLTIVLIFITIVLVGTQYYYVSKIITSAQENTVDAVKKMMTSSQTSITSLTGSLRPSENQPQGMIPPSPQPAEVNTNPLDRPPQQRNKNVLSTEEIKKINEK